MTNWHDKYTISTLFENSNHDLTALLSHFQDTPWTMLLDSSNSQHPDSRFDIFVTNPVATITHQCGINRVSRASAPTDIKENSTSPLSALRALLVDTGFSIKADENQPLPFIVGALGYFGYDLGRQFEVLPSAAINEYEAPDMAIGIYAWSIIKDNHTKTIYVCRHNDYATPSDHECVRFFENSHATLPFTLTSAWQANISQEEYTQKLHHIHEYLLAGDCYQVNFAQRFKSTFSGSPISAYLALRQENSAPFSAFLSFDNYHILSISPERFLQCRNRKVQTKPIKGTRPRHQDEATDSALKAALLASTKDKAENLMIVDLLRNDLSRTCMAGSVDVPALFDIESFSAVHHLVSTVTGTLAPEHDSLSLLQHAFPGGSITGAPKIRAMEIIDELEPHRRNIYCGSIGYIGIHNDMDTSICIRTLLLEKNAVYCWAGGGIVLDSEADSEYQETFDKVAKILPVLES
ncbi:aminodeoxychorismate synthase component I [Aestuariibacter sp. AA17]|uniref:aminodeoxychorismate synthase n=2 Tax=Fluctibacter corallii TaxID=2984329 RepID=A0ABT3A9J7_9ALTE|nr:aminodeoxychorismate synthase component I [Aestuariibacter sp. AA17]